MNKTVHLFDWERGHTKRRILSRSFDTVEDARRFADGKLNTEIYVSKGRYKVEWTKVTEDE